MVAKKPIKLALHTSTTPQRFKTSVESRINQQFGSFSLGESSFSLGHVPMERTDVLAEKMLTPHKLL